MTFRRSLRKRALCGCAALGLFASTGAAQSPADPSQSRIDDLERQVKLLSDALQKRDVTPPPLPPVVTIDANAINAIVDQRLQQKQAEQAATAGFAVPIAMPPATSPTAPAPTSPSEVLSADSAVPLPSSCDPPAKKDTFLFPDHTLIPTWDNGGFRFKSADDAFSIHLGGRLMVDSVFFTQSPALRASSTPAANSPLLNQTGVGPGIGDLQDGMFVRRARFVADGTIYTDIDFKVEFDFENFNSIVFDESFIGARNLPLIGMVRFGQMHVPFGLEAYDSSRFLPMMERSPLYDAFYNEFAPGVFTNTSFLDQRLTMQTMVSRIDNFAQFSGASFGDGKFNYTARVSGLPIYEDDGKTLLHLGFSYQYRTGGDPADFNGGTTLTSLPPAAIGTSDGLFRFRSRTGLRDSNSIQGDNNRIVDTGNILAQDVQAVNFELLGYWNSAWIQAETCITNVDDAVFPASSTGTPRGDLTYWGTYVQVGYFLTGEQRGYDKSMGRYGRVVPNSNFFMVGDDNGNVRAGSGAWELVYRYAYLDLNSGGINGGLYSEHTLGLNWYWNPNIKFQLNYINGARSGLPAGASAGTVQGFGIEGALEF
jgi:phosphate-selective porin OprO and OprP